MGCIGIARAGLLQRAPPMTSGRTSCFVSSSRLRMNASASSRSPAVASRPARISSRGSKTRSGSHPRFAASSISFTASGACAPAAAPCTSAASIAALCSLSCRTSALLAASVCASCSGCCPNSDAPRMPPIASARRGVCGPARPHSTSTSPVSSVMHRRRFQARAPGIRRCPPPRQSDCSCAAACRCASAGASQKMPRAPLRRLVNTLTNCAREANG